MNSVHRRAMLSLRRVFGMILAYIVLPIAFWAGFFWMLIQP